MKAGGLDGQPAYRRYGAAYHDMANESTSALKLWKERLAYFLEAEAKATSETQKFELKSEINQARAKIRELEGSVSSRPVTEIADDETPGSTESSQGRIARLMQSPPYEPPSGLRRGLQFGAGRWTLRGKSPLGQGRFGTVWRALDVERDEDVAVKFLLPKSKQTPQLVRRFFRGAQVLKSLHHAHIIEVFEAEGVERGFGYFVMEYLSGESVQARIRRGAMSLTETKSMVMEVGAALQYLHRHDRVHRDVKPSNILQDAEGRYKLGDFHMVHRGADETTHGGPESRMSLQFTAPEVMMSEGEPSPTADVFSLGMTVLAALYGPKLAKTAWFKPNQYINKLVVHEAIRRVLYGALTLDVDGRTQTIAAFTDAFEQAVHIALRVQTGPGTDTSPPSMPVRPPPSDRMEFETDSVSALSPTADLSSSQGSEDITERGEGLRKLASVRRKSAHTAETERNIPTLPRPPAAVPPASERATMLDEPDD